MGEIDRDGRPDLSQKLGWVRIVRPNLSQKSGPVGIDCTKVGILFRLF